MSQFREPLSAIFLWTTQPVEFSVEGDKDAQVTIQLEDDCEYEVFVDGAAVEE